MNVEWCAIPAWGGLYEVSTLGEVRSLPRKVWNPRGRGFWVTTPGRTLKGSPIQSGHLQVALSRDGALTTRLVHRLVLEAFVGPCPEEMEGCHADGDPANNALANLRWDTRSANQADAVRHGAHASVKKTHCPQGHEYTPANTTRDGSSRKCRECSRRHSRNYRRSTAKHIDPPMEAAS